MTDQDYMRRAIELAKRGVGATNPNPLVGAVIVKDGRVIAEGYHARYGELHAERNAIANLKESAEGATIYVTLEPCCHYGKQPPCTEAIIGQKIAKVVIGSADPNPQVSGKGVRILREAGIEVVTDFLREECDALNEVFFHYITTKMPYVVMKYAMTADGKIATKTGASKWITSETAREEVQKMRYTYMGILAGIGTVLADDPMLNVRLEGRRSPVRIICDSHLRIPLDSQICKSARDYQTIVAYADVERRRNDGQRGQEDRTADRYGDQPIAQKRKALCGLGIETVECGDETGKIDLKKLMRLLGEKGIDSILLEGGGTLNESALRAGIVQKIYTFIAPKIFGGEGAKTPVAGAGVNVPDEAYTLQLQEVKTIGEDLLLTYEVEKKD
ncbi:MAG: bifunctional diaminohydroxyphosphoribosylaminopyrimidine deaminase/5-amino-6-(5-phosphoribosylamino)uracil reductase RibD [Lachnospiraceae bacterium]|jgi:diaminohydroxyphosphoribosylaminopyrimidine deaminase/5-amino-6-(5-phosphoribosylamino)uracil reductase|nr:bifunctional diaminohydroxyphosphoribosylaminopyrimidine deaminase/5-amino-6-(5-phosphoribosylamino)uracil reductase RibD [Lachnospiraceae bacterium]